MIKLYVCSFLLLFSFYGKTQTLADFPLNLIEKPSAKRLIVYLSGDGGMNSFSGSLTKSLADNYAIVSLDSRKYFWDQKTPEKLSKDLSTIISHYLKTWNKEEFSIIGYSFGADASLFLAPLLPKDLQAKLKSIVLLSPSTSTDLVIRLSDMMGFGGKTAKYKTLPELSKINTPTLIIFGKDDETDFYKGIPDKKNINKILIPGSHKFNNDMNKVLSTVQAGL